jgi:hypothetical protein
MAQLRIVTGWADLIVVVRCCHTSRYKRWKLGDEKIAELTSVRGDAAEPNAALIAPGQTSSALAAVDAHATGLSFFARGKRGVLFAGRSRNTGRNIVAKFAGDPRASTSSTAVGCWVETEAKWIRVMNVVGIGAQLEGAGTGWLVCERLEGQNIVEFLSTSATHATARWALREILLQVRISLHSNLRPRVSLIISVVLHDGYDGDQQRGNDPPDAAHHHPSIFATPSPLEMHSD